MQIRQRISPLLLVLLFFPAFAKAASPSSITYEGTLTTTNGDAVNLSGQSINFSIVDSAGCVIYSESSATAGDSGGQVSHAVGSGSVIFGSLSASVFNSAVSGQGGCTVSASSPRLLKVEVPFYSISAQVPLNSVPYALEATSVGSYQSSNLLAAPNVNVTPLTSAQVTELFALILGTSTNYLSTSSPTFTVAPKYASAPATNDTLANKAYVDTAISTAVGSVTLPNIGSTGTYVKVNVNAQGLVTGGIASLVEGDIPTLGTAGKVSGNAITSGTIGGTTSINTTGSIKAGGTVSLGSYSNAQESTLIGILNSSPAFYLGTMWTNSDTNEIKYWDGTQAQVLRKASAPIALTEIEQNGAVPGQVLKWNGSAWWPAADSGLTAETDPTVQGWAKNAPAARFATTGSVLDLATVISAGTFGSSTQVPVVAVDAYGRVTSVSTATISTPTPAGSALNAGQFWVGNSSNVAAAVSLSGDAALYDNGALTVTRVKGQAFAGNAPSAGSLFAYNSLSGHWEATTLPSCGGAQTIYFDSISGSFSCAAVNSAVNFSGSLAGDVTGTQSVTTVSRLQGQPLSVSSLAARDILQYNGTGWVNANVPVCGANQYLSYNGTYFCVTDTGSGGLVSSVTSANAFLSVTNGTSNATLTLNVGTAANTVAAGNDARIVGAVQRSGDTMTGALNLGGNDLNNAGNISLAANKLLGMGQLSADPNTAGWGTAESGRTWYNTTSNEIKYWDGSAVRSLGAAGSGLQSLNGLTANNQSFALGTTGSDANIVSSGSTHTFNLPTASGTSRGLLSVSDWLAFNSRLGTATQFAGDVSGTYDNTTVNRIRGVPVTGSLSTNNFLKYNGSAWMGSNLTNADVTTGLGYVPLQSLNGLTALDQTLVTGTSGTAPAYASAGSTHTLNIPMASSSGVTAGLLSRAEYDAFNNKLGTTTLFAGDVVGPYNATTVSRIQGQSLALGSASGGQVLRYNGSAWVNAGLSFSDITTALTYAPVNRAGDTMSGALNLGGNDLNNAGNINMAANRLLGLSQYAGDPTTTGWGASEKGRTWFNASTNEIRYWDGSSIRSLGTAGSGLQSLNGLSANNQSFAVDSTGADFTITSSGSTHTFNLPTASGTSRGLVNITDWLAFNNKLSSSSQFAGDVSGTISAITVNRLQGQSLALGTGTLGQVLKYNGSAWVNAPLATSEVTAALGYAPVNRAGDTMSGNLVMNSRNIAGVGTLNLTGSGTVNLRTSAGNYTLTLPPGSGSDGQFLMTDGNGTTSWVAPSLPANTQPIYQVKVATTGAIALSGTGTFDGISVGDGDRVLVKNQTDPNENGVYFASAGSWSRIDDMNTTDEIVNAIVRVTSGSMSGGMTYSFGITTAGSLVTYSAGSGPPNSFNTAFGRQTLNSSTTGISNTAFGNRALFNNTSGSRNTAFGSGALWGNTSKHESTAIGLDSMNRADSVNSGVTYNTALGAYSLRGSDTSADNTGIKNTALGHSALRGMKAGSGNVGIGHSAGSLIENGSNNIVIGSNDGSSIANSSNNILIADGAGNERIRINSLGFVGIGTTNPERLLDLAGAMRLAAGTLPGTPATGDIAIDSGSGNALRWYNGTGWITAGGSGAGGISSINGLTAASQTLAIGSAGTAPAYASSGSTHILNIPMASASSVTAGLISRMDYDIFNAKINRAGDTMTGTLITNGLRLTAGALPATPITGDISIDGTANNVLRWYNGTSWQTAGGITAINGLTAMSQTFQTGTSGTAPAFLSAGSSHTLNIPMASASGVTAGLLSHAEFDTFNNKVNRSGDTMTGALIMSGQNISNVGILSLRSGTGTMNMRFAGSGLFTLTFPNSLGTSGQVLMTDAGGTLSWGTAGASNAFVQDGNTFGAAATLGTNDNFGLNLETSGSTRMTITSSGSVGIGTASPDRLFHVRSEVSSLFERQQSSTNQVLSAVTVQGTSTGSATEGHGAAVMFQIRDSSNGETMLAAIGAHRDATAFGNGILSFRTSTAGALPTEQMRINANGNVGLGASSPEFKLSLAGDGGIIAAGTYGSGGTLVTSGAGARMIWYPRKGAFRAGIATGTEWNEINIGDYSTATGYQTRASGTSAVAMGMSASATGGYSTAMGYAPTASGQFSVAMGDNTVSSGQSSVAMGNNTKASSQSETVFGAYNILLTGSATTWVATDPLFVIGNGTSTSTRSNAMTVLKNGNVGIGTTIPARLLDVAGPMRLSSGTLPSSPVAGDIAIDSGAGNALRWYNGTAWVTAGGSAGGSGITSINGVTASSQTMAFGTSGNALSISAIGSTHTLNIPMASAMGTASGLISKTDYDAFNNKLGTNTIFMGDISGTFGTTSITSIQGKSVNASGAAMGQFLRYSGTSWVNTALSSADISTGLGYMPMNRAGDTMSGNLNMGTHGITNLSILQLRSSGSLTMRYNGSANYTLTLPSTAGAAGQFLATDGTGLMSWSNAGFTNGGNSFGATAVLGTNDAQSLILETAGTPRMLFDSSGNVSIGPNINPYGRLDVFSGSPLTGLVSFTDAGTSTGTFTTTSSPVLNVGDFIIPSSGSPDRDARTVASNPSANTYTVSPRFWWSESNIAFNAYKPIAQFKNQDNSTAMIIQGGTGSVGGNVGIGTSIPVAKLDIQSNTRVFPLRVRNTNDLGFTGVDFIDDLGTSRLAIGFANSSALPNPLSPYIDTGGNSPLDLKTNGTTRMTIAANGSVGIGATVPETLLDLRADSLAPPLRLQNRNTAGYNAVDMMDETGMRVRFSFGFGNSTVAEGKDRSSAYFGTNDPIDLRIRTGTTDRMLITATGNVGIGTTSPRVALEVNGAIRSGAIPQASGTIFNFLNGNTLTYSAECPSLATLRNLFEGATYTLAITGGTSATSCGFSKDLTYSDGSTESVGFKWRFTTAGGTTSLGSTAVGTSATVPRDAGKVTVYVFRKFGNLVIIEGTSYP